MSQLTDKTNAEFIDYLNRVADDYEESGSEATAEDYRESARRIGLIDGDKPRYRVAKDNRSASYQVFDDTTGNLVGDNLTRPAAHQYAQLLNKTGAQL